MMESIRTGVQKPWFKVLLVVVIISFIFAGYFTSPTFSGSPDAVAEVNGEEIRMGELNNAVNLEASRYGEQFNTLFPTDERKRQFRLDVLDKLINSKLIAQEVEALGFSASESEIIKKVKEIPAFQQDGKFSPALMDQLLIQRGWSRQQFQQMISEDIAQSQFLQIFTDTELALKHEVEHRAALNQQQRSVKALVINKALFENKVEVTDQDIEAYYQAHLDEYRVEEKLVVEYIELKADDLAAKIDISDDEIQQYYETNQDLYRSEEERRVAHILVTTKNRSDEEALAKIQALAKRIKSGEDFAEVAKSESEDFSAENGGDLGFAGRGVMDAEFEKAMFALEKVGDVSGVVKTEFGYHLIKLLEVKPGEIRPLEEVKAQIASRLKNEKAEEAFYIKKDKIAQLAFDNYDSLTPAAAEGELEIKTSEPFSRSGGKGIFANPTLLQEAFGNDVLLDKRNSSAIEISDDHVVILRAKEHIPSRVKSIDEVKAEVTLALRSKKAREAAKKFGDELVDKLNSGESIEQSISELGLSWKSADNIRRNSAELGFGLTQIAFKAPKPLNGSPIAVGEEMLTGDYAVVQVTKVTEADLTQLTDAERKQVEARVQRMMGDSAYAALVKAVREKADIVRYLDRIQ
jgi:peptidyl-prolyl cis-trans isomerase D